MSYYRDQTTTKSWQVLTEMQQNIQFVLIGGWAVWIYTHQLKSKDIDIIVEFNQLDSISQQFELHKNERLAKYEARQQEIQIDVYVPHYSKLGIPVEAVTQMIRSVEGFQLPEPEVLVVLKLVAYEQRKNSVKGRKDLIDIIALLRIKNWDWQRWFELIEKYNLTNLKQEISALIKETRQVEELGLNQHQWSRLKKKWLGIL